MPERGDITVFRIARETRSYAATDLTGTGAAREGGRWNAPDVPMVYASLTRALAALETLVHVQEPVTVALPLDRYLVAITIPGPAWASRTVFDPDAHHDWNAIPDSEVARAWGTAWARGRKSLVASVPSVVVPEESNVIINPLHSDAGKLRVSVGRKWRYDPRLGRNES